jgi:DNA-binding beta-propeller fold protein YncE
MQQDADINCRRYLKEIYKKLQSAITMRNFVPSRILPLVVGSAAAILASTSPVHAATYTFSETIGSSSNLSGPYFASFSSNGNLYVSNFSNNTISEFNSAGAFLTTISSNLSDPDGIAFDSSGNLYVSNYLSNTISEFNSAGTFLTTIGSSSNLDNPIRYNF